MGQDTRAKVEAIFRDVFDDDKLQLTDDLSSESFPAWDSLAHIRLVSAMEDELSLSFTLDDIEAMTSVAKILSVVEAKA